MLTFTAAAKVKTVCHNVAKANQAKSSAAGCDITKATDVAAAAAVMVPNSHWPLVAVV